MSRARQRHRIGGFGPLLTLSAALAAVAMLVGLTGCGTGQVTQTSDQQSSANGASGDIGPIAVRNAEFPHPVTSHNYPAGASVMLSMTIVNTGTSDDRLVSITSPVAGSVRIDGPVTLFPQRSLTSVARVITEPYDDVATDADETDEVGAEAGELTVTLVGLNQPIGPGRSVPVVLLFEQAGELELLVPVSVPGP